jgi:hypothetical protein
MQNTNNQVLNKIIYKIAKLCNSHVVEKDQKTTAASDAMKGSALARFVIAAPAKAEKRSGKGSARRFW